MAQLHELRLTPGIINGYIDARLEEEGYDTVNIQSSNTSLATNDTHVTVIIDRIAVFHQDLNSNPQESAAMKEYLNWMTKKLNEKEAHTRFEEVLDDIFENRVVQWPRIFKSLVFVSKISAKALKRKMPERVIKYKEWCLEYFNIYVNHFITMEGGWLPNTLANIKNKPRRQKSSTISAVSQI